MWKQRVKHPWYKIWLSASRHSDFPWRKDLEGFVAWLGSQKFRAHGRDRFIHRFIDGKYCFGIQREGQEAMLWSPTEVDPTFFYDEALNISQSDVVRIMMQTTANATFSQTADGQTTLITMSAEELEKCLRSLGLTNSQIYKAIGKPIDTPLSPPLPLAEPHSQVKLRQIWDEMMRGCYNEKSLFFYSLGRRGVRVCQEWRNSADTFIAWGEAQKSNSISYLVRKSQVKDFEPDNCMLM